MTLTNEQQEALGNMNGPFVAGTDGLFNIAVLNRIGVVVARTYLMADAELIASLLNSAAESQKENHT